MRTVEDLGTLFPSGAMRIHINKHSEVPVHQQLREQIIFLIGSGELSIGHPMPSVRECARRFGVHKNTVARVYADLVREGWLVSRPGSRLVIVEHARAINDNASGADSLDDLIDRTVQLAQKHGYSLQQLAARLQERLLAEPPDHLLIVEPEKGLGELMREEIREAIGYAPETCSVSMLRQNPGLAIGAVMLTPHYLVDGLKCIPAAHRNVVPITYAPMEPHLEIVASLSEPSMLGVLSISTAGLKTASGPIAGVVGDRHSFQLFLMEFQHNDGTPVRRLQFRRFNPEEYSPSLAREWAAQTTQEPRVADSNVSRKDVETRVAGETTMLTARDLQAMDLLFCDSITYNGVKHPRRIKYQLLSDESLREIVTVSRSLVRPRARQKSSSA